MKIIINKEYGGFGIPYYIMAEYAKRTNREIYFYRRDYTNKYVDVAYKKINLKDITSDMQLGLECYKKDFGEIIQGNYKDKTFSKKFNCFFKKRFVIKNIRTNKLLVSIIEKYQDKIDNDNKNYLKPKVVEIPDDVDWEIEDYDGIEWISEKHRVWG